MLRNRVGCSPDVVECGDSSPLDTKGGDGKVGIRSCSDRFRHFAVPLPETPAKAGLFRPTFYPPRAVIGKGLPTYGDSFWSVKACLDRQSELCHSMRNIS